MRTGREVNDRRVRQKKKKKKKRLFVLLPTLHEYGIYTREPRSHLWDGYYINEWWRPLSGRNAGQAALIMPTYNFETPTTSLRRAAPFFY